MILSIFPYVIRCKEHCALLTVGSNEHNRDILGDMALAQLEYNVGSGEGASSGSRSPNE